MTRLTFFAKSWISGGLLPGNQATVKAWRTAGLSLALPQSGPFPY
jgi:hypothetical protein